ncbi:hypothetical protein [Yinghuangia soli]|uniref:Uncharacterized protein n=1 Tax=Yinghuangia soli TaxID=2908204 RepID=A0AA41Q8P3_9ACTN|nr:hypothetical protein [Yinghuangia soli]MCF2533287.1 hypothetical protein [Yinghuangia soli]
MHFEEIDIPQAKRAEHLIAHPGFWPAYLEQVFSHELDLDDLAEAFDANPGEADAAASLVFEGNTCHLFALDLPDRHSLEVRITNLDFGDESENTREYALVHPDWTRPGFLATIGPDPAGPGLAWAELRALVAATPPGARLGPATRLLLLLPILGDADIPLGEAADLIAQAFTAHGAIPAAVPVLTALAFDNDCFGPVAWTTDQTYGTGILVCAAPNSARTIPIAHGGITTRQSHRLARLLGTAG